LATSVIFIFCVEHVRHRPIRVSLFADQVERCGAVIAAKAEILRNVPPGSGLIGNRTLRIYDPTVTNVLPEKGRAYVLVLSQTDRFGDDVDGAIHTVKLFGYTGDGNAILPEDTEIYVVDEDGMARIVDSADIDYIAVFFKTHAINDDGQQ
jgi:hypothetical protein